MERGHNQENVNDFSYLTAGRIFTIFGLYIVASNDSNLYKAAGLLIVFVGLFFDARNTIRQYNNLFHHGERNQGNADDSQATTSTVKPPSS